jgi:rhodanese-related sulfurtransferase
MHPRRCTAVATALLLVALAAAGCGLGAGAEVGSVQLTVTREFGSVPMLERAVEGRESDTVMRLLESNAEITTRYGGGFVESIDGVAEGRRDGDPYDWFFYVDGIESPIGAADVTVEGGERIWWDYRDWSATNHVPAVVGSWPAPFANGYEGRDRKVSVECEGGGRACGAVRRALREAGADLANGSASGAIRVLVGSWERLRSDSEAALIERGPEVSGVYAEFVADPGGYRLRGLDEDGGTAREFGPDAGLVAATRRYESPPVWLVTGSTPAGVRSAAELLTAEKLRDRYALATEGGREIPLPLVEARATGVSG